MEAVEIDLLEQTIQRLLSVSVVLHLDAATITSVIAIRGSFDLSLQDAIVLATVLSHSRLTDTAEPKCFVSKNWKDFNEPGIRAALRAAGCDYADSFESAMRFVREEPGPYAR